MPHHAICYVGLELARERAPELFIGTQLDVHRLDSTEFGIDEARELKRRAAAMPLGGTMQTFVVVAGKITVEAQNALLKLLEEPPVCSQFCLVVPKRGQLLPTLQSRLLFVESHAPDYPSTEREGEAFVKAGFGERMATVVVISKDKDLEAIEQILTEAEIIAAKTSDIGLLRMINVVRDHVASKGASVKMLLEALALSLPRS